VPRETGRKLVAQNKRARYDYHIEDTWEAGMVLQGTEVKSLRAGRASLVDGYAVVRDGEVWLMGVHIPEYTEGTWTNHEPRRPRKLLLHRREIGRLMDATQEQGVTLIPLSLYFKEGKAKVEIGVGRGKRAHDKRQDIAKREAKREMDRAARHRGRSSAGRGGA
jgi:SsrA-binding protein